MPIVLPKTPGLLSSSTRSAPFGSWLVTPVKVPGQTLIELAGHEEPAVAAAALQRLNGIDFSLVLPIGGIGDAEF